MSAALTLPKHTPLRHSVGPETTLLYTLAGVHIALIVVFIVLEFMISIVQQIRAVIRAGRPGHSVWRCVRLIPALGHCSERPRPVSM
jgi:hypothetical protein